MSRRRSSLLAKLSCNYTLSKGQANITIRNAAGAMIERGLGSMMPQLFFRRSKLGTASPFPRWVVSVERSLDAGDGGIAIAQGLTRSVEIKVTPCIQPH
jgi:hypothetical protein